MKIENMDMNIPPQETPKNVEQEKPYESEHMSVSWLDGENKAFVTIDKHGEQYGVHGNIENEETFGVYNKNELEKKCLNLFGMSQEEAVKAGFTSKKDLEFSKLKWHDARPTSKICPSLEEAQNYAKQMLDDRENWLDKEKYN